MNVYRAKAYALLTAAAAAVVVVAVCAAIAWSRA